MAEDQSVEKPEEALNEPIFETAGEKSGESLETPLAEVPVTAMTAERVLDIWLGAVAIGAESASKKAKELTEQARTLREDAPEILDTWEQRGRPLREQLVGKIRESFAPIPDDEPVVAPPVSEDTGIPVPPPVPTAPTLPSTAARTAKREISALEQRVRELEAQVGGPPVPASEPVTEYAAPESTTTPAEFATFDLEQGHRPETGLADSPYAISETDMEAGREAFGASPVPPVEEE